MPLPASSLALPAQLELVLSADGAASLADSLSLDLGTTSSTADPLYNGLAVSAPLSGVGGPLVAYPAAPSPPPAPAWISARYARVSWESTPSWDGAGQTSGIHFQFTDMEGNRLVAPTMTSSTATGWDEPPEELKLFQTEWAHHRFTLWEPEPHTHYPIAC